MQHAGAVEPQVPGGGVVDVFAKEAAVRAATRRFEDRLDEAEADPNIVRLEGSAEPDHISSSFK